MATANVILLSEGETGRVTCVNTNTGDVYWKTFLKANTDNLLKVIPLSNGDMFVADWDNMASVMNLAGDVLVSNDKLDLQKEFYTLTGGLKDWNASTSIQFGYTSNGMKVYYPAFWYDNANDINRHTVFEIDLTDYSNIVFSIAAQVSDGDTIGGELITLETDDATSRGSEIGIKFTSESFEARCVSYDVITDTLSLVPLGGHAVNAASGTNLGFSAINENTSGDDTIIYPPSQVDIHAHPDLPVRAYLDRLVFVDMAENYEQLNDNDQFPTRRVVGTLPWFCTVGAAARMQLPAGLFDPLTLPTGTYTVTMSTLSFGSFELSIPWTLGGTPFQLATDIISAYNIAAGSSLTLSMQASGIMVSYVNANPSITHDNTITDGITGTPLFAPLLSSDGITIDNIAGWPSSVTMLPYTLVGTETSMTLQDWHYDGTNVYSILIVRDAHAPTGISYDKIVIDVYDATTKTHTLRTKLDPIAGYISNPLLYPLNQDAPVEQIYVANIDGTDNINIMYVAYDSKYSVNLYYNATSLQTILTPFAKKGDLLNSGTTFNVTLYKIEGNVTLGGSPQQNIKVKLIDPVSGNIKRETLTDVNGDYTFVCTSNLPHTILCDHPSTGTARISVVTPVLL